MDQSVALQLEALKLLQQWTVWLITISAGLLGLMGFALKSLRGRFEVRAARIAILCHMLTVAVAVVLFGAIPDLVQRLEPDTRSVSLLFGSEPRGIYGYDYLGLVPLWILVLMQRVAFFCGLLAMAVFAWVSISPSRPGGVRDGADGTR